MKKATADSFRSAGTGPMTADSSGSRGSNRGTLPACRHRGRRRAGGSLIRRCAAARNADTGILSGSTRSSAGDSHRIEGWRKNRRHGYILSRARYVRVTARIAVPTGLRGFLRLQSGRGGYALATKVYFPDERAKGEWGWSAAGSLRDSRLGEQAGLPYDRPRISYAILRRPCDSTSEAGYRCRDHPGRRWHNRTRTRRPGG